MIRAVVWGGVILAVLVAFGVGTLWGRPVALGVISHGERLLSPHNDIVVVGDQRARYISASSPAPLVVDVHQWSQNHNGSFGNDRPLADAAREKGWNYIRPELTGPNNTPEGCCSETVMLLLEEAVDYALEHGEVDETRIYLVGASGGGYTGLCALMDGRFDFAAYNLWVPISDLEAWHRLHTNASYGADVRACTASDGDLDAAEARRRSPLFMNAPDNLSLPMINIYAGVEDGWKGSVPITHSINMFNRLAGDLGHADARVSADQTLRLLELQARPGDYASLHAGRGVLLRSEAANVSLTIFDGVHEGLTEQVIFDLAE